MTDIDPAAVMVAHEGHGADHLGMCSYQAFPRCGRCTTYRLAEALVAAQEDVARLSAYSAAAFDQRDAAQDALAASEAKPQSGRARLVDWCRYCGAVDGEHQDDCRTLPDQPKQAS